MNKQNEEVVENKHISITDAARINNVTRQAIYVAIKLNKLKATKETSRWTINVDDLAEYRRQKYSRSKSTYEGELIFDAAKGYYSVNQVAKILNIPTQKVYYATRSGYLKAHRKGAAWVVSKQDLEAYKATFLEKKKKANLQAS